MPTTVQVRISDELMERLERYRQDQKVPEGLMLHSDTWSVSQCIRVLLEQALDAYCGEKRMKTNYEPEDIQRGLKWFTKHRAHVQKIMKEGEDEWPMTGSDIGRPELWKPAAWRWFVSRYME